MAIEHIRLSEQARDQLIKLKRWTGLKNWNVLCRWGFCVSLAEPTRPQDVKLPADSAVEMTWRVFGGNHADLYWTLLIDRLRSDGIELTDENVQRWFRLHLHRGVAYLSADRSIRDIGGLVARVSRTRAGRAPELPLGAVGLETEEPPPAG